MDNGSLPPARIVSVQSQDGKLQSNLEWPNGRHNSYQLLRLTVSPLTMFHRFKGSGSFLFIPFMNLSRFADSVHGLQDMALLSATLLLGESTCGVGNGRQIIKSLILR